MTVIVEGHLTKNKNVVKNVNNNLENIMEAEVLYVWRNREDVEKDVIDIHEGLVESKDCVTNKD